MEELTIYNKITGKEVDAEELIKDWVERGKSFKIKVLFKDPSHGFSDLTIIPKKELSKYTRNHSKYLLAFGHTTSDSKLYEKSLKAFPTDTLFEKEEYEKWLSKQDRIKKNKRLPA